MLIIREIATPQGAMDYQPEMGTQAVEGGGPEFTYKTYFAELEAFVGREDFSALRRALVARGREGGLAGAEGVVLRAEKHGALYHPASVTVRFPDDAVKLCVNVAATPVAVACLEEEAENLSGLRQRFSPEFLPCPHAFAQSDGMAFLLEDWFCGFHEFHQDGAGRVRLWDFDAGERLLSDEEAVTLYGEAARILTRYFDAPSGASIAPWHHAAGDFVARVGDGEVAARCITVRGYGAHRDFTEAGPMAERLAVLSFFTNMTMRMRLDRVDGVGRLVLAEAAVASAAVAGFAKALGEREDIEDGGLGILDFLGSFSGEELAEAGVQLLDPCPPEEKALLSAAWPEHAAVLVEALAKL
jgi:hypothetical protein